jgi:hypothetical protein
VLQVTSQKAAAGSAAALQALEALATLGLDNGAALLAVYADGNRYAAGMVALNDPAPAGSQIAANLGVLGQVAAASAADSSDGGHSASALVVSKAIAAIDTVVGFAPADSANVGPVSVLPAARVRVAVDLYSVLLLDSVQALFGTTITAFQSATGPTALSAAAIADVLANRIDAAPANSGVQELKEWMALLSYEGTGLGGSIGSAYASTGKFTQFASFGPAVRTRNAAYPIASIGQLASTVGALQAAP